MNPIRRRARGTGDRASASVARSVAQWWAIGAAMGLLVVLWLVTAGTFDLFRRQPLADFYDAQAHALLDGDLAVDPEVLGIEAFVVDGESYMYQGPVPALLRLPIVAVAGDRLDGRLAAVAVVLGTAMAAAAAGQIHWRVRSHLRGPMPVGRTEAALVALLAFVLVAASPLGFQASRPWVFHEAVVWGVAFALGAVDALVAYRIRPSRPTAVLASVLTAASLLSRASVGLGPLVGLVLVCVWPALRQRLGQRDRTEPAAAKPLPLWLGLALAALPLVAYASVNVAKFGTLFSVPFGDQRQAQVDPARAAFLEANDGTFFGPQFVPTTLLRYLDPGGLDLTTAFPFVDFPPPATKTVGDVTFDLQDRAAGLPAASPFLVLLAGVGIVEVARRSGRRGPLAAFGPVVLATAVGAVGVLAFGYVAHRYLGDTVPLLVIGSVIGLQVLLAHPARDRARRTGAVALAALALVSVWIGLSLAVTYQRLWASDADPALTAGFLGFRDSVAELVGGGAANVGVADQLPEDPAPGTLVAVGDCDGLYLADGLPVTSIHRSAWRPVETTEATGHHLLLLMLPERPAGTRVPIFSSGGPEEGDLLVVEYVDDDRVRFLYRPSAGLDGDGRPVDLERGRPVELELRADWRIDRLTLTSGDRRLLEAFYGSREPLRFGINDVGGDAQAQFPGGVAVLDAYDAPLCRRLLGERYTPLSGDLDSGRLGQRGDL